MLSRQLSERDVSETHTSLGRQIGLKLGEKEVRDYLGLWPFSISLHGKWTRYLVRSGIRSASSRSSQRPSLRGLVGEGAGRPCKSDGSLITVMAEFCIQMAVSLLRDVAAGSPTQ